MQRRSALQQLLRPLMAATVTAGLSAPAHADVTRLTISPLPKDYADTLYPAANALKEALLAEAAVDPSKPPSREEEEKLAQLEGKAGELLRIYGEKYLKGMKEEDALTKNPAWYFMTDVMIGFEAAADSGKLDKVRKELLDRLDTVLDYADASGVAS